MVVPPAVLNATDVIASMPGNAKVIVGGEDLRDLFEPIRPIDAQLERRSFGNCIASVGGC